MKRQVFVLLILVFSVHLNAQTTKEVAYYYNEDSIMQALPEFRVKEDSMKRFQRLADSTLLSLNKLWNTEKQEQDSLHKVHGGCWERCHHLSDSAETILAYAALAQLEKRLIDSILTKKIQDTIALYAHEFSKKKKYVQVSSVKEMVPEGTQPTVDVTRELVLYIQQRRR